jgi:hypothetical protein
MNARNAPFDRLRVNGWEESRQEYVQTIMDSFVSGTLQGKGTGPQDRLFSEKTDAFQGGMSRYNPRACKSLPSRS